MAKPLVGGRESDVGMEGGEIGERGRGEGEVWEDCVVGGRSEVGVALKKY